MKVALLYSSKKGMEAALFRRPEEDFDEETEPPPLDLLAECDSDETIKAVGQALGKRHQIQYIEADEKAYVRLARMKPDLVFNIAERLYGPNRESHIPTICEILGIPLYRLRPADPGRLPRQVAGQGDPQLARRRQSGLRRRGWRPPTFPPISPFRPSSNRFTKARARASRTIPWSARAPNSWTA